MHFENIFSPLVACLFIFLTKVLKSRCSKFWWSPAYHFVLLWFLPFVSFLRIQCLSRDLGVFSSLCSSGILESCIVLGFRRKWFQVHLLTKDIVRVEDRPFCVWMRTRSSTVWWEDPPYRIAWAVSLKITWPYMCVCVCPRSDSGFCPTGVCVSWLLTLPGRRGVRQWEASHFVPSQSCLAFGSFFAYP